MGAWQAHRGYILDQLERYDESVDAYRASLDLEPGDVDVMIALGVNLARLNRCEESIAALENAARFAPDLEVVYCYRILAYSELGHHDKAEEMFYLAQQIKEDCPNCFYHMGGSLAMRGLFDKAIYCWGRTLDIAADYPGVKHCIAHAYREQDNLERAREYYLAENRQDPGNVDLLFDMADLELEAGNPEKAAAKLRQIVELDPEYAQAHYALGEVLLDMGEPREALDALRLAAALDPDHANLHLRIGQALLELSEARDADRYLSAAYEEDPDNESVLTAWGSCLLRVGQVDDAAGKFRRLLELNDTDADAHQNLGACHFLRGEYEAGLVHVLRAIEVSPHDLAAMHKAILVLMHMHRWKDARAMIDRALEIDPKDAALRGLRDRLWRHRIRAFFVRGVRAVRSFPSRLWK
jgi:tetratricopeptide (TPR) repeat protein